MKSFRHFFLKNDLLKSISFTVIARLLGALSQFGMSVLLAHVLGPEGVGLFFLGLTITMAGGVVGRFGMDNTVLRLAGASWGLAQFKKVNGIFRVSVFSALFVSVVISITIVVFSDWLCHEIFNKPALALPLKWMAFSIIPFSLSFVLGGALKAIGSPAWATCMETMFIPTFLIAGVTGLTLIDLPITPLLVSQIYFVAAVCTIMIGHRKFTTKVPDSSFNYPSVRNSVQIALPLLVVAVFNFMNTWSSSLILGGFDSSAEVGFYNIAQRTASVMVFALGVVNSVTANKYAYMYETKDLNGIDKLASKSAAMLTLLATPLLLLFLLFPKSVLFLFGNDFLIADNMLRIIAMGQYVNVITGSVVFILMMTGHGKQLRNSVALSSLLTIILSLVLIPVYGGEGAAIATSVGVAFSNLLNAWIVYRQLGIITIPILNLFLKHKT